MFDVETYFLQEQWERDNSDKLWNTKALIIRGLKPGRVRYLGAKGILVLVKIRSSLFVTQSSLMKLLINDLQDFKCMWEDGFSDSYRNECLDRDGIPREIKKQH